jgi:bifunctional DNA-binding transcriptional regulator/antitoxin component of YhaV-PrlF toxin-antitoxin module
MPVMLLYGQSKVFKHGKAKTLYVTIPSKVAEDSAFTIKEGDTVEVKFDKELNAVVIRSKPAKEQRKV